MNNRPIGIFDSGVGGLTVLNEIKNKFPNEDLIYLGDTLNFPYGPKPKEKIIKYSKSNVEFLIRQNVKAIIIACGTATSQALDVLKQEYDIPIIGIINPTVSYIKTLDLKQVGVIATEGTIKSGAWEKAIKKEMPYIEVINKACPMLAKVAEEGKAKSETGRKVIREYMEIFKEKKVQDIILGCTHYPIYVDIIKEELEYDVNLINTGSAVAENLKELLGETNKASLNRDGEHKIFLSKPSEKFKKIAKDLLNFSVTIENINDH